MLWKDALTDTDLILVMCRTLTYLPLLPFGLASPDADILIPLFDDYLEQSDIPFAVFQATLQVRFWM